MTTMTAMTAKTMKTSIPGAENGTIEGYVVAVELVATLACSHDAVVDVVAAMAACTLQLQSVRRPREGIVGATQVGKAVGALALVAYKGVGVAAAADDDGVVGPQLATGIRLALGGQGHILAGLVVVSDGLDVS